MTKEQKRKQEQRTMIARLAGADIPISECRKIMQDARIWLYRPIPTAGEIESMLENIGETRRLCAAIPRGFPE